MQSQEKNYQKIIELENICTCFGKWETIPLKPRNENFLEFSRKFQGKASRRYCRVTVLTLVIDY